jgi:hypothetical protein
MATGGIPISLEIIRQRPELAHMYNAVKFLEGKEGKDLFPRKYEASMLGIAERDAYALFKKSPDLPIKEVIVHILNTYPSDISGNILLKMTHAIVQEWEELSKKAQPVEHELEAV